MKNLLTMKTIPLVTEIVGNGAALSIPKRMTGNLSCRSPSGDTSKTPEDDVITSNTQVGSLYIHVPFCTKKCEYCHFYVIPHTQRHVDLYMEALKKEWELTQPFLIETLYFGGGTPSLLGKDNIEEILSWLPLKPHAEVTLEANPDSLIAPPWGVNRLSLGIQAFDDGLLQKLGRTHSAKKATLAVSEAHSIGYNNISIDLMYDLPGQTQDMWEASLRQAFALPISHISLYNLTIEPHTIFYKKRKTLDLPSADDSYQMLQMAIDISQEAGFERYELSAFAKVGRISAHNIGYWTGRPFIGLGPSACSYWNKTRFRNNPNIHKWAKAVLAGNRAVDFSETLSPFEQAKELLAIGLRYFKGVETELGIESLIQEGWIERRNNFLYLTTKGRLFHDTVAEKIMGL
ncbi:MAG: radical SAM family heme chaperone HemW [Chlamydiales bacterium]